MPVSKPADTEIQAQVAGTDLQGELRVGCYARSAVPGPLVETVISVTERLQRLHDHGVIAEYQITHWPPKYSAIADADDADEITRDELVTEFEQWAEQHGYTLEPAFRRKDVPSSPLGQGANETREQVRVPFVALALYDADTERDRDTEALRGVVPYTERLQTGAERTYTVDEWLSTVEANEGEDRTYTFQHEQAELHEGDQ